MRDGNVGGYGRMDIQTSWVAPPSLAGGLDHIGIQQVPVRIFSTLLPGITVVTDRVANYSFYPWVSWIHHESGAENDLDFIHFLRRAECLYMLIAERHVIVTGEEERFHSRGLVGRNSLAQLLKPEASRPIEFAEISAPRAENKDSYFKNAFGGLGQYYLGSLRELGVLKRIGEGVEISEDIGLPLAKAFDERVNRDLFLKILLKGHVEEAELDALVAFCPCHLAGNLPERDLLIDLLLARGREPSEGDRFRRTTLLLLLELASQRSPSNDTPLDEAFKAACLTGAIDSGEPWQVHPSWEPVVEAWASYERNDLLSIATLGIFWIALGEVERHDHEADHSGQIGAWVSELARAELGDLADTPVASAIRQAQEKLPPVESWSDEQHEYQDANTIREAARTGKREDCLRASVGVLLALAARHGSPHPYVEARVPADYLRDYPLNLSSFFASVENEWSELSVADWLGELSVSWGVEAHLRVALRKLHHESKDTFLVRMTDEGLRMPPDKKPPLPGFTASRLDQAVQFSVDLGLASWGTNEEAVGEIGISESAQAAQGTGPPPARIASLGRTVLEELRG
jgi:hypothetical protein